MSIKRNSLMPVKQTLSDSLQSGTRDLALKQVVSDLTSTNRGNEAITTIAEGKVVGFKPIPKKITVTIVNGSASEKDICFLNNADFKALPASVTMSTSDGFEGKLIARLMAGLQNANGLLIYGFNVTGYDDEGAKSDAVINALEMEARYYTGRGDSYIPAEIDLAGGERNTQTKDGLLTVKMMLELNFATQLKVKLGAGEKVQFVFFTQPLKD
jgi:hypothetical protein